MPDSPIDPPLRVGIPIPEYIPSSGGGFGFQQTIFRAIWDQQTLEMPDLHCQYIPIELCPGTADLWGLAPESVCRIRPSASLRAVSLIHSRLKGLIRPWTTDQWKQSLSQRFINETLRQSVDVLWTLDASLISDQIPYILTVWDLQHRLQPFFPEVSSKGRWERREKHFALAIRKAFLNITGTQRGAEELHAFYGVDSDRTLVNPFPCPPPLSLSSSECDSTLAPLGLLGKQFLLYPAQFWSHKNHLCLLSALRILKNQGCDLKLVFTGSDKGGLTPIRAETARLGLTDVVIFAGFVSPQALAALYLRCFALVFPSFFGPDNIPPLEAMSYGSPVLVADVPGAREQYGDAALRFNPGSPRELADHILRLLGDSALLQRLILSGQQLISRLYPHIYIKRVDRHLASSSLALRSAGLITH